MRLLPLKDKTQAGVWTAKYIANRINSFQPTAEKPFVLGLPTGSTPIPTYQALIQLYQQGEVSFQHVVTFIWMNMWVFPLIIRKAITRSCMKTFFNM